ncbi:MAG: FMN-binding negative transcriptional regulator [Lautropia sp.]
MYVPAHFAEQRPEALHALIHDHPLGVLVTRGADGLDADHLPFEFDPKRGSHGVLTAHCARANPLWQQAAGAEVLVIFRAAEGYISPNWYPSKHETHRLVPTWNYSVVHAHGRLAVHDDERFVRGVVARLTRQHEADEPKPWRMTDSTPEFIDSMLRAIVGLEITIERLVGKAKLSQNRAPADAAGAIDELAARGRHALADAMRDAPRP